MGHAGLRRRGEVHDEPTHLTVLFGRAVGYAACDSNAAPYELSGGRSNVARWSPDCVDASFSLIVEVTWLATLPATFTTSFATPPRLPNIDGGRETRTAARTPRTRPRDSTRPQRIRRPGPPAARGARGAFIFGTFIGFAAATGVSFIRGAETFGCLGCFGGLGCFGCDRRGVPTRTCGRTV